MTESRIDILSEARRSLEEIGIDPNDRHELIRLLDILLVAIEKAEVTTESSALATSLAASPVSSQALLTFLKQQSAELNTLRKLSLHLTSSLDMSTVLNAVVREAMGIVQNAHNTHIFLYKNRKLEFGAAIQSDGTATQVTMPRRNGLTYTVARRAEIVAVEDMQTHPLFAPVYGSTPTTWGFGSIIGIPLKIDDNVVGVMNLARTISGPFSDSETRLLSLLADQAALSISNASLHQEIQDKAYSDMLTGLPNRRALDERLEKEFSEARRTGEPFSVVMMDLDGFKAVNDTYGHVLGDEVLRLFFNHIAEGIRASDFLARYGGDELCLIMGQTNLQTALAVAGKITENMKNFLFNAPDGKQISLGLSGGVAVYPDNASTASDLLRAADEALYRAKRHERGNFLAAKKLTGPLPSITLPPFENK